MYLKDIWRVKKKPGMRPITFRCSGAIVLDHHESTGHYFFLMDQFYNL